MSAQALVQKAVDARVGLFVQDGRLGIRAAKGALSEELKAEIQARKDELVAYLQTGVNTAGEPDVTPRVDQTQAPLSFGQQRLWFLHQLNGADAQYNMPMALHYSGGLDVQACRQALQDLVDRHHVLRTTFHQNDGAAEARQHVTPGATLTLEEDWLNGSDSAALQAEVERRFHAFTARVFDLGRDLLLRASLLHLPGGEGMLLLCTHHIVSDGWSTGLLVQELGACYAARTAGQAPALVLLPVQYGDFAQWQRDLLKGRLLADQLGYWTRQLADLPPFSSLLPDRARLAQQSFVGMTCEQALDADLVAAIAEQCRLHQVTLFMYLETAFACLVSSYTGSADVVMGTPLAGRTRRELEGLVGFFLNNLVLRSTIDRSRSFAEQLAANKAVILDAYRNDQVPLDKVVDELGLSRSLSHHPVYQIKINLNSYASDAPATAGKFTPVQLGSAISTTGVDLALDIFEGDGRITLGWMFSQQLFSPDTMSACMANFDSLLRQVTARPEAPLAALTPAPAELQRLAVEWQGQTRPYEHELCIHELVERHGSDAPAVIDGGLVMSYRSLHAQSNQLANYLHATGVQPGQPVGLCCVRGADAIVAILAILKAGACYVPIDPDYPEQRIAAILADAGLRLVLGDADSAEIVEDAGCVFLPIERTARLRYAGGQPESHPHFLRGAPDAPAYMIFTSGSTGRPKGVRLAHRGLLNLALNFRELLQVATRDRVLQFASLGFDASVWEWVMALSSGAALVIASHRTRLDSNAFARLLREQEVSVATLPPAYLASVAAGGLAGLRLLVLAGEVFEPALAARLRKEAPRCRLVNAYGPTEATVCASLFELQGHEPDAVPIGRPLLNTQCHVLDDGLQPLPAGAVGQLFVGGPGVAIGYVGAEEQNATRFVANPFGPDRLYATGDMARWRHDGQLLFLGRADQQLKMRGYRIEPGEIESQLMSLPEVEFAHVQAVAHQQGGRPVQRLVAWVLGRDAGAGRPEAQALVARCKSGLRGRLPDYMQPDAYVRLQQVPLNAHGKIDTSALPKPRPGDLEVVTYTAPRTPLEQTLCSIWQAALGRERVGVDDNFFALGGDSILSIQVVARARHAGIEFAVRNIFDLQTVARLAASLEQGMAPAPVVPESAGELPLAPIQRRFYECEHAVPGHYNQAFLVHAPVGLARDALAQIATALIGRHDVLRLRFTGASARFVPSGPDEAAAGVVVEDLSDWQGAAQLERLNARCEHWQRSLDLEAGPVFRLVHFANGATPGRLLMLFHHLVVDGVSWRVLLDDLRSAYRQWEAGRAIELPPRGGSYQAWCRAQADHARSESLRVERRYWMEQLDQPLPALAAAGGPVRAADLDRREIALPAEATAMLLGEANEAFRTRTQELLLAALALAYARLSGAPALRVGLESHGRQEQFAGLDVADTVGWFTSLYPLVLPGVRDAVTAIKQSKERHRAVPADGIGFGILRYMAADPELAALDARSAQAEVLFNYLGQFEQSVGGDSLFALAAEPAGTAKDGGSAGEHALAFNALVAQGLLHCSLSYARDRVTPELATALLAGFETALLECLAACRLARLEQTHGEAMAALLDVGTQSPAASFEL